MNEPLPNYLDSFKEERNKSLNYQNKPVDMREIMAKAVSVKKGDSKDITYLSHLSKDHVMRDKTLKKSKAVEMTVKDKLKRAIAQT